MCDAILRMIRSAGFHVSVHRMIDYAELHAVPAIDPDSGVHIARADGGDSDEHVRQAALALAELVGVDPEGL